MFVVNEEYDRNALIAFVGSNQQQSGIIYGNKDQSCVIVTSGGKHGKRAGYGDLKNEDGTWNYIGQGSKGDQDPYSHSNRLLTNRERNVLLFSTREPNNFEIKQTGNRRKKYKFEGIFDVLSWEYEIVNEGSRIGDKLVKFRLIPAKSIYNSEGLISYEEESPSEEELEKQLEKIRDSRRVKQGGISIREYILRSELVKVYALKRAKGVCELCGKPAPFKTIKGKPFLEVHHILKLADDGPDAPENVAALCPNCHREAHFGEDQNEIKQSLLETTAKLLFYYSDK